MASGSPVTLDHYTPIAVIFDKLSILVKVVGGVGIGPNAKISSLLNAEY